MYRDDDPPPWWDEQYMADQNANPNVNQNTNPNPNPSASTIQAITMPGAPNSARNQAHGTRINEVDFAASTGQGYTTLKLARANDASVEVRLVQALAGGGLAVDVRGGAQSKTGVTEPNALTTFYRVVEQLGQQFGCGFDVMDCGRYACKVN